MGCNAKKKKKISYYFSRMTKTPFCPFPARKRNHRITNFHPTLTWPTKHILFISSSFQQFQINLTRPISSQSEALKEAAVDMT